MPPVQPQPKSIYYLNHILHSLRIERPFELGSGVRETLTVETGPAILDRAVATLTGTVLAGRVITDKQTFSVETPASWWQHLKLSLPERFRRRWPPRMTSTTITADFTRYETFPRASLSYSPRILDELGAGVIWDELSTETTSEWPVTSSGPATVSYASHNALARALVRRLSDGEPEREWDSPHGKALRFLDALSSLGVSVDQLVRDDMAEYVDCMS